MSTTNNLQMIAKLRRSHIPPYTYGTNFEREQLTALRDRITSAPVLNAASPINFYLYAESPTPAAMRRVCMGVGLMAKALCIQDRLVIHTTLAGFLREQRMREMEREQESTNPVMSKIGSGYIAICDFLEHDDVEQKYGYHSCQLAADYLIEHVEYGGGLILGATNVAPRDVLQYGSAFSALLDMFESYRI